MTTNLNGEHELTRFNETTDAQPIAMLKKCICVLGVGLGIGRLAAAAVESMARQPEVAGNISTTVLITAAMIEGATFFGILVCML